MICQFFPFGVGISHGLCAETSRGGIVLRDWISVMNYVVQLENDTKYNSFDHLITFRRPDFSNSSPKRQKTLIPHVGRIWNNILFKKWKKS